MSFPFLFSFSILIWFSFNVIFSFIFCFVPSSIEVVLRHDILSLFLLFDSQTQDGNNNNNIGRYRRLILLDQLSGLIPSRTTTTTTNGWL